MAPGRQVGFRCPPELFERIQALVGTECRTVSDAIILLIQRGLTVEGDVTDADVRQRLTDVEQRLAAVEKRFTKPASDRPGAAPPIRYHPTTDASPKTAPTEGGYRVGPSMVPSEILPRGDSEGGWLNTGDAYTEAHLKGYEPTQTTFRRDLRQWRETGQPPARLAAMGMRANLEVRAAANDKDNSVKWLRFED